jgi:hypothetical protein
VLLHITKFIDSVFENDKLIRRNGNIDSVDSDLIGVFVNGKRRR